MIKKHTTLNCKDCGSANIEIMKPDAFNDDGTYTTKLGETVAYYKCNECNGVTRMVL